MNIPQKLLERMVTFDLKGDDDHEMKATVVENETVLQKAMSKMKSLLDNDGDWIVGFDVKSGTLQRSISSGNIIVGQDILVLCVKHQCVIILMGRLGNLPSCLANFLCDGSICFVGRNAKAKIGMLKHRYSNKNVLSFMENGVEVAPFTARVLMLPKVKGCCTLGLLGKEIGLVLKENQVNIANGTSDWVDLCLSEDDILNAIDEAYKCCKIARFACESLPDDRKLA